MGWFWADPAASSARIVPVPHASSREGTALSPPPACPMHQKPVETAPSPPPSCPMHRKGADAPAPAPKPAESACPYKPDEVQKSRTTSTLSKFNPLNYMFTDLSQEPAPSQKINLAIEREPSTIPKGTGDGNWEYPSPQQMYNALLRKGYHDTDPEAVTSMVSVHNFLNEGAWKEIRVWEGMFSRGLSQGWKFCQKGERGLEEAVTNGEEPSLMRFQGRPKEMTPKAAMWQVLGWLYPSKYQTEPPFDRHDWFVQRKIGDKVKEVRYVIDYYEGPDEASGEPVFYLDVRPAIDSPILAMERIVRAGGEIWYKASGAAIRQNAQAN